ncbi:MAG: hypothetical protein E7553_02110 [Ruminococcaceae bacterium]|nr:hypothetical protein [Oscillospiraceae bacterium]
MKRSVSAILLSIALLIGTMAGMAVTPASAQETAIAATTVGSGDYNGDGKINLTDLMAVTQYISGQQGMTAANLSKMDVFGDGTVDIFDAMCVYNYINGVSTVFAGEAQTPAQPYADFALETVQTETAIKAGETVEIALTVSQVSELIGLELRVAYDSTFLSFKEAVSAKPSATLSVNDEPIGISGAVKEVWMTMLSLQKHSFAQDDTVVTLCFEAVTDITMDTAVTLKTAKAVSAQAVCEFQALTCGVAHGGVAVTAPTTTVPAETYVTYTVETVSCEGSVAAGETVTLNITASEVADLNGLQLNVCFDDTQWEWVEGVFAGKISRFSYQTVNPEPLHPLTDKGEVWMTAMDIRGYALAADTVVATVTLKAKQEIRQSSVIGLCYAQASSYDGTVNGYEPQAAWVDGGVTVTPKTYTGPFGEYFYKNNVQLKAYQLVAHNGAFYFVSDGNKLAKSKNVYLNDTFVSGHTYADGTPLSAGTYSFDAEGKMIIKNGPVGDKFYKNNTQLKAYQLVEFEGHHYFISDAHKLVKGKNVYLNDSYVSGHTNPDGTPMQAGTYTFDAEGRMIIKNGPVGDNFYRNNTQLKAYQLVEFEGYYYFISDAHKLVKGKNVYLNDSFVSGHTNPDGSAMQAGTYTFDAEGRMIIKNGPVGDNFYKNNTQLKAYQLVEFEGYYYFISDAHKLVKGKNVYLNDSFVSGHTNPDGTPMQAGTYTFDAEGRMIIKNGPVGDNFYKNNTQLKAYQLVEFEGEYYFVSDAHKLAKNKTVYLNDSYVSGHTNPDGTPMQAGTYSFDAEGKMIIKNGPVGDNFYKNNVQLKAYQLAEFEGNFYFVSDAHKLAKNKTVYLSESYVAGFTYADGTPMQAGTYSFDAEGKMIIRNGVVGDGFYRNNVRLKAYQLVEFEGDFYFIGDGHKVVKGKTQYLTKEFVEGVFTEEGYPFFAGYYTFDEDGKLIR